MSKKKTYKALRDLNKEQAQEFGETIEILLYNNNGEVTPEIVLKEARRKSSPIHDFFEWDNDVAAEKYRLSQARRYLAAVVEVVDVEGKATEARSFHHVVNANKEDVYVPLKTALNETNYTFQLLNDAETYIEHFLSVIKLLKTNMKK
jgi:hypothetical protein